MTCEAVPTVCRQPGGSWLCTLGAGERTRVEYGGAFGAGYLLSVVPVLAESVPATSNRWVWAAIVAHALFNALVFIL